MIVTWRPPIEQRGDIIRYEVTYSVNGGRLVVTDVERNTTFTIPGLPEGSTVSNITVTAFTRVGPGEAISLPDVVTIEAGEFPCPLGL